MILFVTRVLLPLCLMAITTSAFSFDPRTGECEGEFTLCPAAAAAAQCKMDKRLQCFLAELNKEVIFTCVRDGKTNNTMPLLETAQTAALPCSNASLSTSNFNSTNDILDEWDLQQFFSNAKPALVVMGAIGGVILMLAAVVCIAARSKSECCCTSTDKSKDEVRENACYY